MRPLFDAVAAHHHLHGSGPEAAEACGLLCGFPGKADCAGGVVQRSAGDLADGGGLPRVCLVANRMGELNGATGGGSLFREKLYQALKLANADVTALTAGRSDMDHVESVRGPLLTSTLQNLALTASTVSQQDLVIVSGTWTFITVFTVLCSLFFRVPCLAFVTTNSQAAVAASFTGVLRLLAWLLYMATDYFNCLFSVAAYTRSEEYCQVLRKRGIPVRGSVFFNAQYEAFRAADSAVEVAVARERLSGGHPEKPLLLFVGRIVVEKRIELLLAAKPKNAVLAIVGNGAAAELLLKHHNPEEGVVCHFGTMVPQSELRVLYKAADIHVSASDFETLGNTVHEALICGCPVVVQNAGGYVSQVMNGRNGYLVDWEDPKQVEGAITKVLNGELTRVAPLVRDVVDAVEVAHAHMGHRRPIPASFTAAALTPLVVILWLLARIYELAVQPAGLSAPKRAPLASR